MYPSIDLENNIAPNTQIGKVNIEEKIYDNENRYVNEKYERGGEFIENLVCDNILEFCHRWLGLANFKEFLNDIEEYYKLNFTPLSVYNYIFSNVQFIDGRYITCPITHTVNNAVKPFIQDLRGAINPFTFENGREVK